MGTANSLLDDSTGVRTCVAHAPARDFLWALPPDKGQILSKVGFGDKFTEFLVFALDRTHDLGHADRAAFLGREEGGEEGDVAYITPRDPKSLGEEVQIDVRSLRRLGRKDFLPNPQPVR